MSGKTATAWLTRLVAGSLLVASTMTHAQQRLRISESWVEEGGAGTTTPLTFRVLLDNASDSDVTASLIVEAGTAAPGTDYVDESPIPIVLEAGRVWQEVTIPVIGDDVREYTEYFTVRLVDIVGASGDPQARMTIVDDEGFQVVARDEYEEVSQNTPLTIKVLRGAVFSQDDVPTAEIVQAPQHGTAQPATDGSSPTIVYTPVEDYLGPDRLVYRLCDTDECDEASVELAVKPRVLLRVGTTREAGSASMAFDALQALPGARFSTSPLVEGEGVLDYVAYDSTPHDPWDTLSYNAFGVDTIAGGDPGVDRAYRVIVDLGLSEEMVLLGVDDDGDGLPSPEEVRCTGLDLCEADVVQSGSTPLRWWWMVVTTSNPDAAPGRFVRRYAIPFGPSNDRSFDATGPGHTGAADAFDVTVGWRDDTMRGLVNRDYARWRQNYGAGLVEVFSDEGVSLGHVTVIITRSDSDGEDRVAMPLVSGRPHVAAIKREERHRHLFIDVPEGATRLTATIDDPLHFDAWLVKQVAALDPAVTDVARSPHQNQAADAALGDDGTLEVSGAALTPGRWYVVPRFVAPDDFDHLREKVTVTATIEADAPPLQAGSWFNPDRGGSGLFLYPAGSQWTGLLYTYGLDGLPTWYYLQAPVGASGQWHSPVWRAAWDGDSRHMTEVGELIATPLGDSLTLSYMIDGYTGSQSVIPLGAGCPTHDGAPLDVSSTWFDPAHGGTGYSVQMWDDYEYYAAYLYDAEGRPRFVAAESGTFAGTEATLVLQQLTGPCPTCSYAPPVRTDIGLLTRRFAGGTFEWISTDLEFDGPLAGGWTQTDAVVPLGGPDSTQGCAP